MDHLNLQTSKSNSTNDKEDLHSVALTQQLVQNIMKSLPPEVRPSFNDQFSKFRKQCPANVRPPATFGFLTQFVEDLEKNYRSTPYLYDLYTIPIPSKFYEVVKQVTTVNLLGENEAQQENGEQGKKQMSKYFHLLSSHYF